MSVGQGSISVQQKAPIIPIPGPPFSSNSADNGLSVDHVTGRIVLGQDLLDPGYPASLLSSREVPVAPFSFGFTDAVSNPFLLLSFLTNDLSLGDYNNAVGGSSMVYLSWLLGLSQIGDAFNYANGNSLSIDDFSQRFQFLTGGINPVLDLDLLSNTMFLYTAPGDRGFLANTGGGARTYQVGDIDNMANQTKFIVDDLLQTVTVAIGGIDRFVITPTTVTSSQDQFLHRSGINLVNNAGAAVATLNNSPTVGDPTKWIPIDDNGVTRNIPAW